MIELLLLLFVILILFLLIRFLWQHRSSFRKRLPSNKAISVAGNNNELFPHMTASQKEESVQLKLPRKFRKGHRGIARGITKGNVNDKNYEKAYISFRLEAFDDATKILTVEIISKHVDHFLIHDGDKIVVNGKINNQGILQASDIFIINTNTAYKIKSGLLRSFFFHLAGFVVAILALVSFVSIFAGLFFDPVVSIAGVVGLLVFAPLNQYLSKR